MRSRRVRGVVRPMNDQKLSRPRVIHDRGITNCTCGWKERFGYGVAFTLAVFEAKRLLVLVLEIFAEWQVIRFAGGLQPVAFTFADIVLGLPCALITIRAIRRRTLSNFRPKAKHVPRHLLIIIAVCAVMNMATLASIGYHVSVRQETLIDVFNTSMRLYGSTASYKYAIDEIQFMLRCCGHTFYTDWFLFDWQSVDYASREEMAEQSRVSDEDYRDRSVPFSCCDLRVTAPCVHTEMTNDETINVNGCAAAISPILLRIVIVAYVMTSTLIIIQVLLAFLITKMVCRFVPSGVMFSVRRPAAPHASPTPKICGQQCSHKKSKTGKRKVNKRRFPMERSSCFQKSKPKCSTIGRSCSISSYKKCARDIAEIKPSVHEEHRISVKRLRNVIRSH